jgi:hypothetical protein
MKRITILITLSACCLILPSLASAQKQKKGDTGSTKEAGSTKEVYTGTIMSMSGGARSTGFTLTLEGRTSDEEAQRYRSILANEGQEELLKAIRKNVLGFIAATGQTRRDLLVVREAQIEGSRRIIAAFERWQGFYEVRGGYRSTDYPYSIIEIVFDHKGRGTGTFIGLAQVQMKTDKKTEQLRLEIENFGSFPSKVMGVMRRN